MTPLIQKIWMDKTARLRRDLGRREHEANTKRLRAAGVRGPVARIELPFSLERFRQWLLEHAASFNSGNLNCWTCPFCHVLFTIADLSVDHATPLSMGGATNLDNLLAIDKRCNTDKGDLGAEEFKSLRVLLMSWDTRMQGAFWRRWRTLAPYLQRRGKDGEEKPRRKPGAGQFTDKWLQVIKRSRR